MPSTKTKKRGLEVVTANISGKAIRHAKMAGREYLVCKMVMITEGVHSGNNGPLYYPHRELSDLPQRWDHKPVVINHPTDDGGESVSACTPDSVTKYGVGVIMNTRYDRDNRKLRAEAWLEEKRLKQIAPSVHSAIMRGKIVEVSTGLFSENLEKRGEWNGEKYIGVARNYKPDHLAILTDGKGACSVEDGAGLLQLNRAKDRPDVVEIRGKVYAYPSKQRKRLAGSRSTANATKKGSKEKREMLTKNKRIKAAKEKIVAGLIKNKHSEWDKEDKDALMLLKLSKLKGFARNAEEAAKAAKAKQDEETEEENDDTSDGGEEGNGKKGADKKGEKDATTKNKKLSIDEWFDKVGAPAEFRKTITNSITFEKKSRQRLIKTIIARNEEVKGPWTEDKLKKMETEMLNDLAATLNARSKKAAEQEEEDDEEIELDADFSGRGFEVNSFDDDEEDDDDGEEELYLPPSTFNAKAFSKK